jgi:hypothetical protein
MLQNTEEADAIADQEVPPWFSFREQAALEQEAVGRRPVAHAS